MIFRVIHVISALSVLIAPLSLAAPPGGTPIPITNHGFESNNAQPNCFVGLIPTGWTLYDPNGIHDGAVDAVGVLDTLPGGPHFQSGAPEGSQVALVFLQGDIGGGPVGLQQTLGATLQANTRYTLRVQVGDIASGQGPPPCDVFGFFHLDGFPGYRVQLLAGGQVIAEDFNSLAPLLDDGFFLQTTIVHTTNAAPPQLGQALAVRLINLNTIDTPMDPGIEVDFDDVQLWTGCVDAGDLDDNGDVNTTDLQLFVDVLLELDTDPLHINRADTNCSGQTDGDDIAAFIDLFLG